MIIPLDLDNTDIGVASINLVSKNSIPNDYYPDYIPTHLMENNNHQPLHYSHINMDNYKTNIHKIQLNKECFNLIPNMTYSFSIIVKTNNYYIDDNQWKIDIEIISAKTNKIVEKMDYYKIPYYLDNNNSFGWFVIQWFWNTNKNIHINEHFYIIFNSIGIDKCPLSNSPVIYSIIFPQLKLLEYSTNLIPNSNLRFGWDEYSIYKTNDDMENTIVEWNSILDWNCQNIVYPNNIITDSPIIKFKFNYSYINNDERKLYHTYWHCKKNILPLKPRTNYKYSIYIKTTPTGILMQQYNALYTNKLNINNIDYRPKSIYLIIYIGNSRNKLKSEKIEIKPSISGSIYPNKPVIDINENTIENNGWVECVWKFNTEDLIIDGEYCLNLYLFTYSLRPNMIYLYNPILVEEYEYIPVLPNTTIHTKRLNFTEKKILIINSHSNNSLLYLFLTDSLQINNNNIDRNITEINAILEYTNNGIRDIILYYFDSINDIDISINELIKSNFLSKLPKSLKIFIIIDQQPITDIGNKICFRYYYHNKNITTIDNNILEIEKYPTNLYILGWYTNEHNKSLIDLLIHQIKLNNYNISILDILDDIDSENLLLYHNNSINKYDMFIHLNKTNCIF